MAKNNVKEELKLIKSISIHYYESDQTFYSSAELHLDGNVLKLKASYYPSVDIAVAEIKRRIKEAVLKYHQENFASVESFLEQRFPIDPEELV